jgi:hypothetical protein
VNAGDLVWHWSGDDDVIGLILEFISDSWSDRFLILSKGEVYEVPWHNCELVDEND